MPTWRLRWSCFKFIRRVLSSKVRFMQNNGLHRALKHSELADLMDHPQMHFNAHQVKHSNRILTHLEKSAFHSSLDVDGFACIISA